MAGLGIPVENRYACRPARKPETNEIAPLRIARDLDTKGWWVGVENFNFHQHMPHYAVLPGGETVVHVLARQPIDLDRPHPLSQNGEREFNAFLWAPPAGDRAGDVIVADSTLFSTLFGLDESVKRLWTNIVSI
jgi:hypothetical protein